jgi:hypothetical protein
MQESVTYLMILAKGRTEGRVEEARRILYRQGAVRFHKPDAATIAAIERIRDPDQLEALCVRLVDPDVRGWNDLLASS